MDISVKILKWDKHQRKDVKKPSWFALNNRIMDDDDFICFSHGEFKAWIYALCKASLAQNNVIIISLEAAERKAKISQEDFKSSMKKLQKLRVVDVTWTLRGRNASDTLHYNTGRPARVPPLHNITLQNIYITEPPAVYVPSFDLIYSKYPIRQKGPHAEKRFREQIRTEEDFKALDGALITYLAYLKNEPWRKPKQTFATFLGTESTDYFWKQWVNFDPNQTKEKTGPEQWAEEQKQKGLCNEPSQLS